MNAFRFIVCVATLSALIAGSDRAGSQVPCSKNHYILDHQCLPPSFQIPPVSPGVKRWTAIGPDGANVAALVTDPVSPSIAFAGTLGSGALKTLDGGKSWATVNAGLATSNVLALAIDPATSSTLYAGTDAGVFKSIDGGGSWVVANTGLDTTSALIINDFAIDPASPGTVYALARGGLFKTTNGAASWTSMNAGLPHAFTRLIAIDRASPSTVYLGVDDTVNDSHNGVLKSTDGGASWTQIYTAPCDDFAFGCTDGWSSVGAIAVDPHSSSRLYVASGRTLAISDDGGATWSGTPVPAYVVSLAVDPASSKTLYAATFEGSLLQTTDSGKTWVSVADGPLAPAQIVVIAMATSAPTIYAGGSSGIYGSSDAGLTWTRLALGVRTVGVFPVAVDPGTPTTIYASTLGAVMKTIDGGAHWAESAALPWTTALTIDPVTPSVLYAIQILPSSGASTIYKSTDAGAQWARPSAPFRSGTAALRPLAIAPTQPSTLFIGVNFEGVFKSTDGGSSWALASDGITAVGPFFSAMTVDPTTAGTVYAATPTTGQPDTPAKMFKSTDGAAHWSRVPMDLPSNTQVTSIVVDPATPSIIYAAYADYGAPAQGGVFRSSDGGVTWVAASQSLPATAPVVALAIDPSSSSRVYAATSAGVFMSADGAASWAPINAGLPNVDVWNLAIDQAGSVLRAATIAGLFEYKLSGPSPSATVRVIEYYHAAFDHYFITVMPDEIHALDNKVFIGWTRTGLQFNAYAASVEGTSPVCRFFSTAFVPQSSHFYTPFASECAALQATPFWRLESSAAFHTVLPTSDGLCTTGSTPVYRLHNNGKGGAPNHRYTIDLTARATMIEQGWVPEGLGVDAVGMCSPP